MNIKPQEIDRLINDFQYKYINLQNSNKETLASYNATPQKLNAKVKSIKQLLNNVPDGIYYVHFKIAAKGNEFQYIINKGNVILNEPPPINVISAPANLEKFQTLQEWKRQEQEISELKQKLALMEYEKNAPNLAEEKKEEKNVILGFAETVLPMFLPIVDKYMTMKERELAIKEQSNKKPVIQRVIKKQSYRPVPDLTNNNFANYETYFCNLPDEKAEAELVYLENNKPEIYEYLNRKYYDQTDEV